MSSYAEAVVASDAPARGEARSSTAVRAWLFVIWGLVLVMVVVGGITRLTGSGLSIVHWQRVSGIIPPLNDHDWQALFEQYRGSPQFRQVNHWMALSDFKRIFVWEYVHRLIGRLIGFAVLLPALWFAWRRRLPRGFARKALGLIVLGGLQGLLGWYMVESGLIDEPRVSHFRLAAHLLLAFATGSLVLWLALDLDRPARAGETRPARARAPLWASYGMIALILLQCMYGAFMAGTHAGYYFGTFPDMDGAYAPASFFTGASWLHDAFNSPVAIHYLHRAIAWLLLFYALTLAVLLRGRTRPRAVRRAAGLLGLSAFLQLNLGAMTVISRVAIPWAVLHQAMAYLLLSSAVLLVYRLRTRT